MPVFYEKEIGTILGLRKELSRLDSDAGIRIVGRYANRPCFAFVTRFLANFTVMVYERRGHNPSVGKRILSREFESLEELEKFLRVIVPGKIKAYAY